MARGSVQRTLRSTIASALGVAVLASLVSVIGFGDVAGASSVTAVSFTPTTTAAGVYSDYLVGFTPTGTISSALHSTITVTFPSAITVPSSPTIATVAGFSGTCAPTLAVNASTVTVTLVGSGCQLAGATAGVFALYGFTNPSAQTLTNTQFSLTTSVDTTAVSPSSSVVIIPQYPVIPQFSWPGTVSNPGLRATVNAPGDPIGIASDGNVVWVAGLTGNTVEAFNLQTSALVQTITLTGNPTGIAIDGNYLWINLFQGGSHSVEKVAISGSTDTPGAVTYVSSSTGQQYYGICGDGNDVWTAQQSSTFANYLYEIPVGSTTASQSINLGTVAANQVSCDGTHVWVAEGANGTGSIAEINEATGAVVNASKFPASTFPGAYGIFSDGRYVYITSDTSAGTTSEMWVLDAATGNQISGSPFVIPVVSQGVISDGTDVWVAGTGAGSGTSDMVQIPLSAIIAGNVNLTTNETVITLPNGAGPRFLASTGNEVWLTEQGNNSLTELSNTPQIAPNNGTATNPYEGKYSTLYDLPDGAVGSSYSQTFTASGGNGSYTYAVVAGAAGTLSQPATTGQTCLTTFSLTLSGNVLSGTPSSQGTCTFTIKATDTFGLVNYQAYQLTVGQGVVSSSTSTIAVANGAQPANGTSYATVTVTLKDALSDPLSGVSVSLGTKGSSTVYTATGPLSGTNSATSNSSGVATFYVTDTTAESVTYTALAQSASISGSSGTTTAVFSLLAQSPLGVGANPASPVAGQPVTLNASGGSDNGAVTYSLVSGDPASCAINAGVLTSNLAVTCAVTATMAGNAQYAPVTVSSPLNVTFGPGPVSATTSSVVVTNPNQPPNGTSYATVTVTLKDQYGNVIPNQSVSLTNIGSSSVGTIAGSPPSGPSSANSNSSGVATFYVTDTTIQTVTYGALVNSTPIAGSSSSEASFGYLSQGTLNESANPTSQTVGQYVVISASGGSTGLAITYQLASGAPTSCQLNSTTGELTTTKAVVCPVIATMAGNSTYGPVNSSTLNVPFTPGPVDASTSSIVVTDGTEPADGASFAIVTVNLEDSYNNAISGATVTLTNLGSSSVHTGTNPLSGTNSLLSDSLGTATFYVTDATVENVTYSAMAQSVAIVASSGTTVYFGLLPQASLVVSALPTNPVAGTSSQVSASGGSGTGAPVFVYGLAPSNPSSCAVSSSGVVTSTQAVTCQILVTRQASGSYGSKSATINVPFVAGPVSSSTSTVVASPTSVTNPGTTTVTVTLEDQYGNPVTGQSVALSGTGSAAVGTSPVNTGSSNIATFTVSDTAVETATLSATDGSQSSYAIGSTQVPFSAASTGGGGGGGGGSGGVASLLINNTTLPGGVVGQSYSDSLTATGASGPTTWTCSGLPAALACSTAGVVSGTPTVSGTFSVTISVTSNGQTNTVTMPLTVTAGVPTTGAPSNVTAVAGDSDAFVTFVPPSDASQLSGVKYTITASSGGATCVTTATSCLVSGLTNGTTYTFSVVATSTSPTATSPPGMSNPVTPSAAPILEGSNGMGTTTLALPIKSLSPGSVIGTILNGSTSAGSLGVSNSSVTARSGGVTMTIATSSTISTTTGFTVVLVKKGVATVTGTGFLPGSVVDLYIFSPQIFLGNATVKTNGTYSSTVRVPSNVPAGNDIVLSQGFVKSGARASVSVGIVVDASNAALLTLFPFATGSAALTPTMDRQLQSFALEVKKLGTKLVVFTGFTDTIGASASNLALGDRRAQGAATYLRQALLLDGVTARIRFVSVSKGSTAPSASNLTTNGRARNRNVTVFAILF